MATHVRVKLKKAPFTESVITVKAYNLLKKKYTFIEYATPEGEELTEVQKIMAEKKAQKKSAEAVVDEPKNQETAKETEVSDAPVTPAETQPKKRGRKPKAAEGEVNEG